MATNEWRAAARRAVLTAMAERGWVKALLAERAGLDPDTVRDFLDGRRWPKEPTLAALDRALGWAPGTLDQVSRGLADPPQPTEPVKPAPPAIGGHAVQPKPDWMTQAEYDLAVQRGVALIDWEIERTRRDRQGDGN